MAKVESHDSPLSAKLSITSLVGSAGRTRLNDITNFAAHRKKAFLKPVSEEDRLGLAAPAGAKDYAKLLQENAALLKLLDEKNAIIEYHNVEIQKFKVTVQKLQQQTWQLAQSNSLMLADLNLAKDRLKLLQHELSCSSAVLKTKTLELEELKEKLKMTLATHRNDEVLSKGTSTMEDDSHPVAERKPPSRKRASTSQACSSIGNVESTDKDGDQRRTTRRRSSTCLESQSSEPAISNLPEVEEPVNDQPPNSDLKSLTIGCNKEKDEQEIKNPTGGKIEQKQAKLKLKHGRFAVKSRANELVVANLAEVKETSKEGKASGIVIRNVPVHRTGRKKEENVMRRAAERGCAKYKEYGTSVPINSKQIPIVIEDSPTGQRDSSCSTSCSITGSIAEHVQSEDVAALATGEDKHERKSLPDPATKEAEPPAGRPSRRATIGISYKERPINIKMRRPT